MRDTPGYRPHRRPVALTLITAGLLGACGRSPVADADLADASAAIVARPQEVYTAMAPPPVSRLRFPLVITREAITALINAQLPDTLLAEQDFGGHGFDISVVRAGPVDIEVSVPEEGPTGVPYARSPRLDAQLELPLRVRLRRPTLLADLAAAGELRVELATRLTVEPDWSVRSVTQVQGHEWVRAPRLSVGALSLPIRGITDLLIDRLRGDIAAGVDAGISASVSLGPGLAQALATLSRPTALSDAYGGYLTANPSTIGLGPFRERAGDLMTAVEIGLRPEVTLGVPPAATPAVALPQNTGAAAGDDDFEMAIYGSFDYGDMEAVLAKALQDTTLEAGGRRATVREVEVYGQRDRLVIGLRMDGDYRGWAYVKARPRYDREDACVRLDDLDFALDTRNLLHRAVAGVFRKRITRLLDEQIGQQVDAQLEIVRKAIAEQLAGTEVAPGVRLDGEAAVLRFEEVVVTPRGLSALLEFRGSLRVRIEHLP